MTAVVYETRESESAVCENKASVRMTGLAYSVALEEYYEILDYQLSRGV